MIALLGALAAVVVGAPSNAANYVGETPAAVTVATSRGEQRVEVRLDDAGAPVLAAPALAAALGAKARVSGSWAEMTVAQQQFRFLIGAPLYLLNRQLQPLAATVSVSRDTVLLPLQFVSEILPRVFAERFHYDAGTARLVETGADERLANGLRPGHVVTIDPGHGGVDPGNLGIFFPRGVREKNVTLQVGLRLRDELKRRGIGVRMTRTTDTLIDLHDRGAYCSEGCDLFVSLHVNSVPKRTGSAAARGFETFFLAEAKTEEAARVAQMENEAVRFEASRDNIGTAGGLDFILKDLQLNEHLRESARIAELVQARIDKVHPGLNRGVKQAGFMVLTTARRPAILVEMGYSTNREDGRFLTAGATQQRMAVAIADAVTEYLGEYERKTGAGASPSGASRSGVSR